jgi:hypothetical protein
MNFGFCRFASKIHDKSGDFSRNRLPPAIVFFDGLTSSRAVSVGSSWERTTMDWDRNRYFALGVVLFLLGMQFRMIDAFVLNETSTRMLHRFAKQSQIASTGGMSDMYMSVAQTPKKTIKPPNWIGWVLLTSGTVIGLHALAMPRRQ